MGIPCVVGVAGVTAWLNDGDSIRVDGSTGRVQLITPREGSPDA
jgi:phosphohistidine swiveling domain-containing protein